MIARQRQRIWFRAPPRRAPAACDRRDIATGHREASVPGRSAFFAAFAPAELDRLATRLVERRYADRQMIFSRGDPGTSMMVVVDGRVRAFQQGGRTIAELNTTGSSNVDMAIEPTGLHALSAADLIL